MKRISGKLTRNRQKSFAALAKTFNIRRGPLALNCNRERAVDLRNDKNQENEKTEHFEKRSAVSSE